MGTGCWIRKKPSKLTAFIQPTVMQEKPPAPQPVPQEFLMTKQRPPSEAGMAAGSFL